MFSNLKEPSSLVVTGGGENSAIRPLVHGWWLHDATAWLHSPLIWLLMDTEASGTPSPSRPLRTRPVTEKPITRKMGWTQAKRVSRTLRQRGCRHVHEKRLHLQFQTVVFHFEVHPGGSHVEGDPFPPVERHLNPRQSHQGHVIWAVYNKAPRLVRTTDHGVLAAGQRREGEGPVILGQGAADVAERAVARVGSLHW